MDLVLASYETRLASVERQCAALNDTPNRLTTQIAESSEVLRLLSGRSNGGVTNGNAEVTEADQAGKE